MASRRHPLSYRVLLAGLIIVTTLTAIVWALIELGDPLPVGARVGVFALAAILGLLLVERWFTYRIIRPLAITESIAVRLGRGDLRITEAQIIGVGGGPLTDSLRMMVSELRRLIDAIKQAS